MHKWRRYLIVSAILLAVIGGVVCYDVYRAQSVAIETLTFAGKPDLNRLEALIDGTAITNSLYKDIEPFEAAPQSPPADPKRKRGFLNRIFDQGAALIIRKKREPDAPPLKGPDLHLCAQAAGEPEGFATLIRHLKPTPVKTGWKPDPRIRYGSFNARQYNISGDSWLVVAREGLLDWKVKGVKLTDAQKRQVARTCVGII
ncbi:hypothetical protein PQU92_06970 [Asticcacaulis sp. BYS171W]|uniref:DUF2939 domain-containing protein n=1 Tax=Asticcacaulis aquaticus TaxID=2984212 RepID=A0ABT5HSG5_9CAUL|nr:hypothetical protein [Asticcacaulis aquaticus]MDC7683011.1 hypothetical protein [Asticcacaulis aquaticus]